MTGDAQSVRSNVDGVPLQRASMLLSSGVQRVCIVDQPKSSVDSVTEARLQQATAALGEREAGCTNSS